MSDDLDNRGNADRIRINVHEDHEVRYWTGKLGVSRDELERAVAKVGPMTKDVEAYFAQRH